MELVQYDSDYDVHVCTYVEASFETWLKSRGGLYHNYGVSLSGKGGKGTLENEQPSEQSFFFRNQIPPY